MKFQVYIVALITLNSTLAFSQKARVVSPNEKHIVELHQQNDKNSSNWYLVIKTKFNDNDSTLLIPKIDLGLVSDKEDYTLNLKLQKAGKAVLIRDNYTSIHGKRTFRSNNAYEKTVQFVNNKNYKLNVIIRAYNDGVAFRYELPERGIQQKIKDEKTAYTIEDSTRRWLQKFNPANEGYYRVYTNGDEQKDWAYPALFLNPDSSVWYLIHEADLDRNYCGTKLTNFEAPSKYKLTFPDDWNGRGLGESEPTIALPWKSPWRVIIIGSLADVVESTLVDDVSEPCKIEDTDWIKPGLVSWNYWSHNHGTKDFQIVCDFADLAARMGWPYTLLDWEWDAMTNGGNLEDALSYIHSIGIKPLIWYNSGGEHNWVPSTPKDRMLTHENRVEEFTKLNKLGVYGVKVDFFESEKQNMINYYIDLIEDAAAFEIMVYFHGCLVPRGWARTYPNLMTYEGVRGAEWYNNVPDFTLEAPVHNTILPFTRNVVGSMDYTPVTFTNSQHPHLTSFGHELALCVLFESALQHLADRPQGYDELPFPAKQLLTDVPVIWDNTKLLNGFPGKEVIMARRKGNTWYIAGINAELIEKQQEIALSFLEDNMKYRLTLIEDGIHDKVLKTTYRMVDNSSVITLKMLRRGGFTGLIEPIK